MIPSSSDSCKRSYLLWPILFHFMYLYCVIGPAAIVVKLDIPSHPLQLDLMEKQTLRAREKWEACITLQI